MKFDPKSSPFWNMKGVTFPPEGSPELDIQPWHPDRYDDGISPNARCLNCGCPRKCHVDDKRCNRITYTNDERRKRQRCPCERFDHASLPVPLKPA